MTMTTRDRINAIPDYPSFRTSDGEMLDCRTLLTLAVDALEDALAVQVGQRVTSLKRLRQKPRQTPCRR
jgi:hypothetical protein